MVNAKVNSLKPNRNLPTSNSFPMRVSVKRVAFVTAVRGKTNFSQIKTRNNWLFFVLFLNRCLKSQKNIFIPRRWYLARRAVYRCVSTYHVIYCFNDTLIGNQNTLYIQIRTLFISRFLVPAAPGADVIMSV